MVVIGTHINRNYDENETNHDQNDSKTAHNTSDTNDTHLIRSCSRAKVAFDERLYAAHSILSHTDLPIMGGLLESDDFLIQT